ncbi:hypothetical protein OIV83_003349 [Microbotryomycetes sp. JL201]|nr:hypothetical protein OIV83_003349 [Microbotryomycetes sp. JL201]
MAAKPSLLRKIVTGVHDPVSPAEHVDRWNGKQSDAAIQAGGRVASMVDQFERASLSDKHSPRHINMTCQVASPPRQSAATRPLEASSANSDLQQHRQNQLSAKAEFSSPTVVPAALFQKQQVQSSRCTPPSSPARPSRFQIASPKMTAAAQAASAPSDKENRRIDFHERPLPHVPARAHPSCQGSPSDSQVSSVPTAATRDSSATHAGSLATAFGATAECSEIVSLEPDLKTAVLGAADAVSSQVESRRDIQWNHDAPARAPDVQLAPPRIIETAPTPQKSAQVASRRDGNAPSSPLSSPRKPSPPMPPRRQMSRFTEDLPPSPPLQQLLPPHTQQQYSPLPLDTPSPLTNDNPSTPAIERPRRTRASTVGTDRRPLVTPLQTPEARSESFEERTIRVETAFAALLNSMQLPDRTVRDKMLQLSLIVKEEMRSPVQIDETTGDAIVMPVSPTMTGPATPKSSRFVRKTKSTTSLRPASAVALRISTDAEQDVHGRSTSSAKRPGHARTRSGSSLFRSLGKAAGLPIKDGSSSPVLPGGAGSFQSEQLESVQWWAKRIQFASCAVLDPKEVGKLRGRLRNEPPTWVREFVKLGGYKGLLMRLKELLEVEWREEQHDDQVLHELLRCFKALTLTSSGRRSLASQPPVPFASFADLLFSDKRPGDLPCRQLLVELLHSLYDVCPARAQPIPRRSVEWKDAALIKLDASTSPAGSIGSNSSHNSDSTVSHSHTSAPAVIRRYTRKAKAFDSDDSADERDALGDSPSMKEERIRMTHLMVHSLVQGPVDEKEESRVEFIKDAHKVRRFRIWVKEMSDVVRDYFWIFCHSQNLIWTLEQVDVDAVERPKVPSGMTGGVEYEAMAYASAHFRLINAIARNCASTDEAFQFHNDLFESGFERVLLTLRRASTTYYPTLHLGLSRYVALARSVRFNLGPRILSCLDSRHLRPEERMVVQVAQQKAAAAAQQQHALQQHQAPQLGDLHFS